VIVLLTWFYITGFIFLMGGEMNAILENAGPEEKDTGTRTPGRAPEPQGAVPGAIGREPQGAHR
jgi:membrane protein